MDGIGRSVNREHSTVPLVDLEEHPAGSSRTITVPPARVQSAVAREGERIRATRATQWPGGDVKAGSDNSPDQRTCAGRGVDGDQPCTGAGAAGDPVEDSGGWVERDPTDLGHPTITVDARGPDEGGRACRLVDREKAPRVRFGYAVAKPWAIRRRAEQQCLRDIKCNARGGRWDRTRGARAGSCQLVTRPRLIDAEISERGDPANERDLLGPGECGTRSARACKDRHRNTVCCRGRDRGDTVLLRKRHFHRGCYEGAC